jgi:hypothetical protein
MTHVLRGCGLLALVAALGATLQAGDSKDTEKIDPKKVQTKEKIESSGQFVGQLTKLDAEAKKFTVRYKYVEIDQNKVAQNTAHYNRRIVEINGIKNPQQRAFQFQQLQLDMQRRAQQAYKQASKDFDLQAVDAIKVRVAQLPTILDEDTGKPKKLTKDQIKELKGDPKLPGYNAEFNQLRVDQTVTVYLAKKAKTKKDDPDTLPEPPKVVMIMIMSEPTAK